MTYDQFQRRAEEMFDTIPLDLRGGIEYVAVSRDAIAHPDLPDVFTMGECATGELDLGMDFPAETRSGVHLYYGSFKALSEVDPDFDWEGELWETLTHEIRHHRESTAGEDALEDFDYAADENFKRREDVAFDPFFYRAGEPLDGGGWDVDGDRFAEVTVDARQWAAGDAVEAAIDGVRVSLQPPEEVSDVAFLYLEAFGAGPGETAVVLVRRRGAWEALRGLFSREAPDAREWTVVPEDWRNVG